VSVGVNGVAVGLLVAAATVGEIVEGVIVSVGSSVTTLGLAVATAVADSETSVACWHAINKKVNEKSPKNLRIMIVCA